MSMRGRVAEGLGLAVGMVGMTLAMAQAPTVDEQLKALTRLVDTQYERVVREKILLGTDQPLVDPGAKVFRLTEQLRVTTQQCRNREDEAYQLMRFKDGQIASAQLTRDEQTTLIQGLRAQVESLEKALKDKTDAGTPADKADPAAERSAR